MYSLSLEDIMKLDAFEIDMKIIMQYFYSAPNKEKHNNLYSQINICQDFSAYQPNSYFGCIIMKSEQYYQSLDYVTRTRILSIALP
jgi:hypothetical protein